MASLLAQLPGPINLRLVLSDLKLSDILHDLVTARGNRFGVPRALAVDRNEPRELAGTLHIEGTSKDDAIAQIRAINALVTVGTTLTLQSTGATDAVTLNILPSRGVSQPLDELFELPARAAVAAAAATNIIPAMTSATEPSGVASASSEIDAARAAYKAFDHLNTDGESFCWISGEPLAWLQYQFPTARVITRYAITSRNSGASALTPREWTFEGSNDGSTWTVLDAQTDVIDWASTGNARKVFDFANTTAYTYCRLDITGGNWDGGGYVAVGELEMMEADRAAVTGTAVLASCSFSFTCEPYAYGPETTVYENSGAVLPNVIDIDVPGDYPTPLKFSFDQIASGTVHAMYIGMLPDQATPLSSLLRPASGAQYAGSCYANSGNPAIFGTTSPHGLTSGQTVEFWNAVTNGGLNGVPYLCTVISPTTFSVPANVVNGEFVTLTTFTCPGVRVTPVEDVNCFSGSRMAHVAHDWASWEIDDRSMPPGTYLPLVRMAQVGAGMDNVFLSSAASTGSGFWSTDTTAAYSLSPLSKTLGLPYYKMVEAGATWATPKLWWIPSGGTPTLYMDYLALMPTTWGWAFYHDTYPSAGAANWMLGYDGLVYKNLRATPDGRSGGMLAVGARRVFMVAAERHDGARASAVTGRLIIRAVPRYTLWA